MKKNVFLIIGLMAFTMIVAKPRDVNEGLRLAEEFISQFDQFSHIQRVKADNNPMKLIYNKKSNITDKDLYYVFGNDKTPGFVIVSADDEAYGVLGYSLDNIFDSDNLPENMKYWLEFYENELNQLQDIMDGGTFVMHQAKENNNFASFITPLLGGIKWNQDSPYNELCPTLPKKEVRASAGCIATAMAQIMKYYEWPQQGIGSKSYTSTKYSFDLSADFSSTTYDWKNMTDTYSSQSTEEQKNAVSTLVYHCGVSVEMDYAESSGAFSHDIAPAMINHFGYDDKMQLWTRDFYTQEEWIVLLKTELNASRPVLYGGVSDSGGHQFILDGYDENDFFHINWGWGGMSDGYFRISSLDPNSHGIGGGIGGFDYSQSMYTGIQKPVHNSSLVSQLCTQAEYQFPTKSVSRTSSIKITVNRTYNFGVNTLQNLKLGLAFYDMLGERVSVVHVAGLDDDLEPLFGFSSAELTLKTGIPDNLAPGKYQMYVVFKSDDDADWLKVRYFAGNPSYLDVNLTASQVRFSIPENEKPELELLSLSTEGKLYKAKTGRFKVALKNKGKDFNSEISLALQSKSDSKEKVSVYKKQISIPENEMIELVIHQKIEADAGDYNLFVLSGERNIPLSNDKFYELGEGLAVTVYNLPLSMPRLELLSEIYFSSGHEVYPENVKLTAVVKNTGGYFEDDVVAFVFSREGGSSLTYFGYQTLFIDKDETVELKFEGSIDLDAGDYLAGVYFNNEFPPKGWNKYEPEKYAIIPFTLKEKIVDAVNLTPDDASLVLFPLPAKNYLNVQLKGILQSLEIYDIAGQLLFFQQLEDVNQTQINTSNFETGMYIMRVFSSEGINSKNFIVE